jgi:hypothetical protein
MANLELNEEEQLNNQKSALIDDLMATVTVMEEVWNYHPDNPNKKDIVQEYKLLERIKSNIEKELSELG